ncbi:MULTISPECIES: hypothetical protein [unclassified Streptomyces]|uniref:hypothetical protein n=1 Tax=unclassified Streptomyces TaxID=2593676 RepID=UPI00381E0462
MAQQELDMELDKFRSFIGEALADGGTQHLIKFTDEELAVLDPDSLVDVVAPTPHLDAMSDAEREWVLATALRSLVARDLVEVENIEELDAVLRASSEAGMDRPEDQKAEDDAPVSGAALKMKISPEVDLALVLRRTAGHIVVAEQQTIRGSIHALVYVHARDLLLVERITGGGMHIFTLANSASDAAEMLQALTDPFGVADEDGPARQLDPQALDSAGVGEALNSAIENALVVTQLVVLSDPPGSLLTTYATENSVWTVLVHKPHDPKGITARAVGNRSLTRSIRNLILAKSE